jgi:hypothetical protein
MSGRIDFAAKRRTEGRAARKSVDTLIAQLRLSERQGIDLSARVQEAGARYADQLQNLARRLRESVLPLFVEGIKAPRRVGSCVLVRLEPNLYAFTAAHVMRGSGSLEAGSAPLLAPPGWSGENLLPLPWTAGSITPETDPLDAAVLFLPVRTLGPFEQRVFLSGDEIDEEDRPDDRTRASFYTVLGYSQSRTQVKLSRASRQIHQQLFHCATSPAEDGEYLQENLSRSSHVLLGFDHEELTKARKRTPPRLQGVSGGGIFQISRDRMTGPLIGIATENRRTSRLIVGTRLKPFLAAARNLIPWLATQVE